MSNRTSRMLMCAVAMAVLGTVGNSARATVYSVIFDPSFTGEVKFSIGDGCRAKVDGFYAAIGACEVDLISADIVDSTGKEWDSGFQYFAGLIVQIVDGELSQLLSRPILLEPVPDTDDSPTDLFALTSGHHEDCDGILQFLIGRQGSPSATFRGCHTSQTDTDTYALVRDTADSRIPEPGTLGLILGGVGVAWLTRRRRLAV